MIRRTLLCWRDARGKRLCPTDCVVLSHLSWRQDERKTTSVWELAALLRMTDGAISKSFARLRRAGWLDAQDRRARPLPELEGRGYLQLTFSELREHGRIDALVWRQLQSLHGVKKARAADGQVTAARGLLSAMLGRSRDGIGYSLGRLARGDTLSVRVLERRARRTGSPSPVRAPLVELRPHGARNEHRHVFRVLEERARRVFMQRQAQRPIALELRDDQAEELAQQADRVRQQLAPPRPGVRLN